MVHPRDDFASSDDLLRETFADFNEPLNTAIQINFSACLSFIH